MTRMRRAELAARARHVIRDGGTSEADALVLAVMVLELVAEMEADDRAMEQDATATRRR